MAEGYINVFLPKMRQLSRMKNYALAEQLNKIDKNTLKFIIEASYNILKGVIPLSNKMKEIAKKRKQLFRDLAKSSLSLIQKRKILYENPSFAKSIIRRILETFSL